MATLHAFLHPETPENQEVIISSRFKDENGNVVPFVIRAISQAEANALKKQATKTHRDRTGALVADFDSDAFSKALIIAGTLQPDFRAKDLCDEFGVLTGEDVLGKMLLVGEYQSLSDAIGKLSGLGEENTQDEAKN